MCLFIGVKVHSRSVYLCKSCAVASTHWVPGGHVEASPYPPPLLPPTHPPAGCWPWQGLTESCPGGGSTELHSSPLSQPTQSVQVYWRLDKHTHTHTQWRPPEQADVLMLHFSLPLLWLSCGHFHLISIFTDNICCFYYCFIVVAVSHFCCHQVAVAMSIFSNI